MDYSLLLGVETVGSTHLESFNKEDFIEDMKYFVYRESCILNHESAVTSPYGTLISKQDWKIASSCNRYIYHISIIDFLQRFNFSKKKERLAKLIKYTVFHPGLMPYDVLGIKGSPKQYLSCIEPQAYCSRFKEFMAREVFCCSC